jgi:hypothetical protein
MKAADCLTSPQIWVKENESIFPYADHVGYASCAYASQFCICASFLQKTYPLHLLIQVIRVANMQLW